MTNNADQIHANALVADMHCDTVMQMKRGWDISQRHDDYHLDIPRLQEGGVNLQVFASCYSQYSKGATPFNATDRGLDVLTSEFDRLSDRIKTCFTATEARETVKGGRIAAVLAVEGGIALDRKIDKLSYFHDKGVRLLTIAHEIPTGWCINWSDKKPPFDGLNDLGQEMIREMNRLGIIIDVSHSAGSTVDKVLEISTAPIIASHSGCNAISPTGRNLTDDHIKAIAGSGGIVGVTFINFCLSEKFNKTMDAYWKKLPADQKNNIYKTFVSDIPEMEKQKRWEKTRELRERVERDFVSLIPTIGMVADHIDHIVNLVGPNHVGIGSDYDGMSMPPVDLEDCSGMPNLTKELIARNYSEEDIRKILGGNFMRVFGEVCG